MKILYVKNEKYNSNKIMVHSDNSFGTNTKEFFDFQVSLTTNRSLILNFDTYTKKCVSCEGYLFFNKKTKYKTIDFYKYADGNLKIELSDFEKTIFFVTMK